MKYDCKIETYDERGSRRESLKVFWSDATSDHHWQLPHRVHDTLQLREKDQHYQNLVDCPTQLICS